MVWRTSWIVVEGSTGSDSVRGRPRPANVLSSTLMFWSCMLMEVECGAAGCAIRCAVLNK